MMFWKRLAVSAFLSVAALTSTADAALQIQFSETAGGVTAVTSGSLDLNGLTQEVFLFPNYSVRPSRAQFGTGSFLPYSLTGYSGFTGPASFGTGNATLASTFSTGDNIRLSGPFIGLDNLYVSGSAFNATSIFAGQTFATLGVTPGEYVFRSSADTITVRIGSMSAAVPEPSTWALMLLGFGAIGVAMRRRRCIRLTVLTAS